jgi:hypothetical protein
MANKKLNTRATSDKLNKLSSQATRSAPAQEDPIRTEAREQAEPIVATVVECEANPMLESSTPLPPPPAEAETTALDQNLAHPSEKVRKLSALDAAAKVLSETGQAMSCAELIAAMAAKGYWSSPKGKTPASTLYAAVQRELQSRGEQARFRKTEPGKFTLRASR